MDPFGGNLVAGLDKAFKVERLLTGAALECELSCVSEPLFVWDCGFERGQTRLDGITRVVSDLVFSAVEAETSC